MNSAKIFMGNYFIEGKKQTKQLDEVGYFYFWQEKVEYVCNQLDNWTKKMANEIQRS